MAISELAEESFGAVEGLLAATGAGGVECVRRSSSMAVSVPGGLEVRVFDEGEDVMVSCERWHTHCADAEETAWCVRWLMSPFSRIVHEFKGAILAAVWVERYSAVGWEGFEPVYFLNPEYPPEWELEPGQRWFRRIYHQAAVPFAVDFEVVLPGAELVDGLPVGWRGDAFTIEVEESMGLALFGEE